MIDLPVFCVQNLGATLYVNVDINMIKRQLYRKHALPEGQRFIEISWSEQEKGVKAKVPQHYTNS